MTNSYVSLGYRKTLSTWPFAMLPLVLLLAFSASAQKPKELHIAAAADLQPVLPVLAQAYEHETGIKLLATFGSSATLTQQLENGAPQDIFLSADFVHPEQLIAANLAYGYESPGSPTPYARGVLVLWARSDSPAQPLTLDSLTKPSVTRIAMANPEHAPYGLAAQSALTSLHLTDAVTPKLVIAENIAQTAQFAESGNAQAGMISLTTANTEHFRSLGTFVRFPAVYPQIRQCAVILKTSSHQTEARDFLRWLTSPAVQQQLPKFGLNAAQ